MNRIRHQIFWLFSIAVLSACQSKPAATDQTTNNTRTDSQTVFSSPKSNSPAQAITASHDFLISPGERVGPITPTTSEADLLKFLGPSVVTAGDTLFGAEGETFTGTTLYKETVDEVQIIYTDNEKRTHPETVLVRPRLMDDEGQPTPNLAPTRWTTTDGIRIGTSLKELERRNGKPFNLWGFEWDYGGMISSWKAGKLARSDKKTFLSLTLGPPAKQTPAQTKAYNKLMGDSEFSSSSAAMQVLNPSVQRMQVSLEH